MRTINRWEQPFRGATTLQEQINRVFGDVAGRTDESNLTPWAPPLFFGLTELSFTKFIHRPEIAYFNWKECTGADALVRVLMTLLPSMWIQVSGNDLSGTDKQHGAKLIASGIVRPVLSCGRAIHVRKKASSRVGTSADCEY